MTDVFCIKSLHFQVDILGTMFIYLLGFICRLITTFLSLHLRHKHSEIEIQMYSAVVFCCHNMKNICTSYLIKLPKNLNITVNSIT